MVMPGPTDGILCTGHAYASTRADGRYDADSIADRHVNPSTQSHADMGPVAHADSHARAQAADDGRMLRPALVVTRFAPGVVY